MSGRVRASIILSIKYLNSECVEMALKECPCPRDLSLQKHDTKFIVDYVGYNKEHQTFLKDFPSIYNRKIEEMLERLRREQADLKGESALAAFTEEDRRKKELEIKRDIKRIEKERKTELEERKKEIEQKIETMVQRAKTAGFVTKREEIKGKVRIQLVRRL